MKSRALAFTLLSLSFSTSSWGADATPSTGEVPEDGANEVEVADETDQAATPESDATQPVDVERREIDWKGPLKLYDLGQVEEALQGLRAQVLDCGEPVDGKCTQAQLATLYASTAVVLAGSGDHSGGVRAFRRALTYSQVRLLPAYKTPDVERALAEARGERPPAPEAPTSPPTATTSYSQGQKEADASPAQKQGKAFFMVSGVGQAGIVADGLFTAGVLRTVGAVSVVSRTGEGMFAMGLRGNGGAYIGDGATLSALGGSVLFGGMGIPRFHNRFGFVLGGLGIETFPGVATSFVALDFLIGRAVGGGTVAFSAHSGFNANEYLSTVGIELGFGGLSRPQ